MLKKHLPLIIFLVFYFSIISYKLITSPTPFFDWDESINAQVAKEMIEKKSLVPLWQGNPWLDKPPLSFLFFAIILKLTPFTIPEISLRITSLLLSLIAIIFVYAIFYKATKNKLIPLLTVIITSFIPIFLQRSQILNLDVFLLIGWLGYLLFVQNFWLSLFFLTVAVLTKSLIGFYPVLILIIYCLFILWVSRRKGSQQRAVEGYRIRSEHWWEGSRDRTYKMIKYICIHILILSSWYLLMLLIFGKNFWQQHIIETHFRRITASIESHFGQRTYYIDLMFEQLGIFTWFALLGLIFVISSAARNLVPIKSGRKNYEWILYSLCLLPWFIFLNLTKTKIFWYLYPTIPQFAFLAVYPLLLLNNRHSGEERSDDSRIVVLNNDSGPALPAGRQAGMTTKKMAYSFLVILIILFVFYENFIKINFFTTFYSKPEDYYRLALYAKNHCDSLSVLVSKETREATKTLEKLGLTITSTKQWGDHPSTIYYFGKKVDFYYNQNLLVKKTASFSKNDCLVISKDDTDLKPENNQLNLEKNFNSIYLFKR